MNHRTSSSPRRFDPIAIVGLDILFPGVNSADDLGLAVFEKRSLLSAAPSNFWRVDPQRILTTPGQSEVDRARTDRGGYITHFESCFDPTGFGLSPSELQGLDPSFLWAMKLARGALQPLGGTISGRVSAIMGLLSFPSQEMAKYCEQIWGTLPTQPPCPPQNRFMSGLPALLLKEALGLNGDAFSLDAACASSLYAIKLACDRLHDRTDDIVLAGAVNRADDLFIHIGFTALDALSPTGQSRPFHAKADGLVPSEGAGFVALCRYEDALAEGYPILGTIRGVGLANDGRGRGLLAPSQRGQARSMQAALSQAGLSPADISFIECHATGTPVGDATELASLAEVYGGHGPKPIGSIKSNLGHPITAAGMAGLTKILQGFQRGLCPPTRLDGPENPALSDSFFRVLKDPETIQGPHRAALSAFGFGGNDAHLLIEAPHETQLDSSANRRPRPTTSAPVAVVGVSAFAGPAESTRTFLEQLLRPAPEAPSPRMETIRLGLSGLKFPPKDLEASLAQQKAVISALQETELRHPSPKDTPQTAVFVGMGCDPEVARWGARWRLEPDSERRDELAPPLTASAVVGTMPNMPANRLSSLLDLHGPSFTVSAEEGSGLVALELARRALNAGEVDRAIVAAVDFSHEPVHEAAIAQTQEAQPAPIVPGDGVALLILMRKEDALRTGQTVLSWVDTGPASAAEDTIAPRFGHAHAAKPLLEVVAQTLLMATRHQAGGAPSSELEPKCVQATDMRGNRHSVRLSPADLIQGPHPAENWPEIQDQAHLKYPAHPPRIRHQGVEKPSLLMSDHRPPPRPDRPIVMLSAPSLPSPDADIGPTPDWPFSSRPEVSPPLTSDPTVPNLPPTEPRASMQEIGHPSENQPLSGSISAPLPILPEPILPTDTPALSLEPDVDPMLQLFFAQKQQIDQLHQAFIHSQTEAQQQFIAMQSRAMHLFAHTVEANTSAPLVASLEPSESQIARPKPSGLEHMTQAAYSSMETPKSPPAFKPFYPKKVSKPASLDMTSETRPHIVSASKASQAPTPATNLASYEALNISHGREHLEPIPPSPKVTQVAVRSFAPITPAAQHGAPKLAKPDLRPSPSPTPERQSPTGPTFDQDQLKVHASGAISEIFGDAFKIQDTYPRQVRMPEPPLLLADRVTGLKANPGSMTTGTIWTETDVSPNAWYLHEGHMPAGIMIESGQADLMLISYLGADFENRGERIYRLLGCDLTYHGGLPKPGDTLAYEIHVDGHAEQGPIRIFFFHYDGWINNERRISVRGGQAGFFTDKELAESGGILWSPEDETANPEARIDPPRVPSVPSRFSPNDVAAFAAGDGLACFGPGYERLATHSATPRISGGEMVFFDAVDTVDPQGGPWGQGYLRAHRKIRPDDWFFEGHFKNDPCMPGTLMFEGCLQTMAFYLAALGFTLNKDGFRFEPVPEQTYRLRCRGQVTPKSKDLIYEIFVREVWDGDEPTLVADLMCTVDGLKAFHAQHMQLRLVPSWPLNLIGKKELAQKPFLGAKPPVRTKDVTLNLDAMLSCAWGRPSRAFGRMYSRFDSARKVPRLPGPPYHFMSRVVDVPESAMGAFEPGVEIEVEYDVPPDAWYFEASNTTQMPYAVLLEAALQPCGWLASYIGSTLQVEQDLFFRNLDGTGTLHQEIGPDAGILTTKVKLSRVAKTGDMIIVGFEVRCFLKSALAYEMDTVFGFFPEESLKSQAGLPILDHHKALHQKSGDQVYNLRSEDISPCHLSTGRLHLLDRVTGWWPNAGEAKLGQIRAEMDVSPDQWFFAAHFFQDPVQPGSLGIEVMLDTLRAAACLKVLESHPSGLDGQRFEVFSLNQALQWKYRGQVLPENKKVEVTLELTEDSSSPKGRLWVAKGSLWVDGKRIYEASGLGVRLVQDTSPPGGKHPKPTSISQTRTVLSTEIDLPSNTAEPVFHFDLDRAPWLSDHQPTWTLPAVPMMNLVDALAQVAGGLPLRLENIRLRGWVVVDRPRILTGHREGRKVCLKDESGTIIVDAHIGEALTPPESLVPLSEGEAQPNPYKNGALFHGPAFQVMEQWVMGSNGASAYLDRAKVQSPTPLVPKGVVDPLLLDGGTHIIPHDQLDLWAAEIGADRVAYPARIDAFNVYFEPPSTTQVEARFLGCPGGPNFPTFQLQWLNPSGQVWADMRLTEATFPKGPLGCAQPNHRRAFLTGHYTPKASLSRLENGVSILDVRDVKLSDWLPGSVQAIYGTTVPETIAEYEHRGRIHHIHPQNIHQKLPYSLDPVDVRRSGSIIEVHPAGDTRLNLNSVETFWQAWFQHPPWLVEDLYYGLIQRFFRRVLLTHPTELAALRGRGVLFLGNHQTMVESLLFSILVSALIERPTVTIAKAEHQTSWLGTLIKHCFSYPDIQDPEVITFFDRDDKASLPNILARLGMQLAGHEKSVMVHVEGTRALSEAHRVLKMSGAFLDLAIQANVTVVPVWFAGGLPAQPLETRLDFPVGMGQQDLWLGRPFSPEELASLPYGPRKAKVLEAMNTLGDLASKAPAIQPDTHFAERVRVRQTQNQVPEADAVLLEVLCENPSPRAEATARLVAAAQGQPLRIGASAEDQWLGVLARRLLGPSFKG